MLLVLDNLHWADPLSLRLLEFVAQKLAEARMLSLGTYRNIVAILNGNRNPRLETDGEYDGWLWWRRVES